MSFVFTKKTNVSVDQEFYAIIGSSIYTHDGVFPVVVDDIDWNDECIIFTVNQPCTYVSCSFDEMNTYVFNTEQEAVSAYQNLNSSNGLQYHQFL